MFRKTLTVSNSNVVLLNESVSDNSGEKKRWFVERFGNLCKEEAILVINTQSIRVTFSVSGSIPLCCLKT